MLKPDLVLVLLAGLAHPAVAKHTLILATTTSTQDSGLLDVLLPAFESATHIQVRTIAVGSGEALAMGRSGDADVLLVHSPAAEEAFMADGQGTLRLPVMHNDFVVAGPAADPARVRGLAAVEAFKQIFAARATFVTRGDQSGTHTRELALWKKAGLDPAGQPWYVSTGQGMGETVRIADEKRAYTLIDRGTWLAMEKRVHLPVLAEGGADLTNAYHVILVSAERHPRIHEREAKRFAEWLVGAEGQALIRDYGPKKYGRPLFVPDAR